MSADIAHNDESLVELMQLADAFLLEAARLPTAPDPFYATGFALRAKLTTLASDSA